MIQGLTEAEAVQRRKNGLGNDTASAPSRSYLSIVRKNVFTFVNMVLVSIGVVLVAMGSPTDAISTAGLTTMNILVGLVQEIRAKRQLDKITLLTRPRVTVIRESVERELDISEIVVGEIVVANPGDQIVCDGQILGDGRIEVDESLLTGESDYISKQEDDPVYSGSFCVSGHAYYETTQVGKYSLANKITAQARRFEVNLTPLQQHVKWIVQVVSAACIVLALALLFRAIQIEMPPVERVQMVAVIVGTIPQGLIFLVTLSYGLGAVRLIGQGVLAQQSNAVESLSNTTVLCMDKTGTLTTNRIQFHDVVPYDMLASDFKQLLGDFIASATTSNRSSDAIQAALPGKAQPLLQEAPFASARKWSGLIFNDNDRTGAYVMGAPAVILPDMGERYPTLADQMQQWSGQGLRVILFTHASQATTLRNDDDKPHLPENMQPLGLIALSDELRPETQTTLDGFSEAGIQLKIISGDDPRTVAALAAQVGFDVSGGALSGADLAALDEAEWPQVVKQTAIFGRINPDQKQKIAQTLRDQGAYVAMVGDGVNDVLALKKAHIGIAMNSGSAAARNVADIVLLNDSFAALPAVFQEGQRIVNGIMDTMRLLLSRTVYVLTIIALTTMIDLPFPFLPTQDALNSFLSAGLPPFLLAVWAVSGQPPQKMLRAVSRFVFPAAVSITVLGLGVYVYYWQTSDHDLNVARAALLTTVVLCGGILVLFSKPPHRFWVGVMPLVTDYRTLVISASVMLSMALITAWSPLRTFFDLIVLDPADYALIVAATLVWMMVLRLVYQVMAR